MRTSDFLAERLLLSSSEHGRINFTVAGQAIANSLTIKAEGPFGTITLSEARVAGHTCLYGEFEAREDTHLTTILEAPMLCVLFNLGASIDYRSESVVPGALETSQAAVLSFPRFHLRTRHRSGERYGLFSVMLPPGGLREWQHLFPRMTKLVRKAQIGIPMLEKVDAQMSPALEHTFARLVAHCAGVWPEACPDAHTVRQMLQTVFEQYAARLRGVNLYPSDIERLRRVHALLSRHPDRSDLSLKKLSQEVGMNVFKLKNGFKELFGVPVFKFRFERRMEKALVLLRDRGIPISEVATMVGYKSTSSFVSAFRRRFGYPPGATR